MMGFMSVASMSHGSVILMVYIPVLIHGYLTCGKIIEQPLSSPWDKIIISPIKKLLTYGNNHRSELIILRADMEVYIGFYLIIGWFFGMSQFHSILLFWQCARVRAMLNAQTRLGFVRFD